MQGRSFLFSRLYWPRIAAAAALIACAACHGPAPGPLSTADAQHALEAFDSWPVRPWREPVPARLPSGEAGAQIRAGIDLLEHTAQLIGPHAPDPAHRLAANNLNCVQCHQAGDSGLPGTKAYVVPLVNVAHEYPKLDPKTMQVITLEERILAMLGHGETEASPDSPQVQAIVAYLHWLAEDSPPHTRVRGTGLAEVDFPHRAADLSHGAAAFARLCSSCHGSTGLGLRSMDFASGGGYTVPPLAGNDSFDDGGHMAMVPLLARFIYTTMPLGAHHGASKLTVDEAYDIAAFVDISLQRRANPNRLALYPDPNFRPEGFVIPEYFPGNHEAYLRARLGPYSHPND